MRERKKPVKNVIFKYFLVTVNWESLITAVNRIVNVTIPFHYFSSRAIIEKERSGRFCMPI